MFLFRIENILKMSQFLSMTSPTKLYVVTQIMLSMWSCDQSLIILGTGTRYSLEILHQGGKRVKTKSQKVLGANSYVCRSYKGKTESRWRGGGSEGVWLWCINCLSINKYVLKTIINKTFLLRNNLNHKSSVISFTVLFCSGFNSYFVANVASCVFKSECLWD